LAKTILLYGNVRFNSAKDASPDELKSTTILFNPGIGYQFNENWAVGLNLALSSSKDETSPTTDVKTTFLQAGPFVRYTQSLGSIFYVYGQAEFGFKSLKIEQTNNPNDFEATGVVANLFPAFAIDLKNKFMVNFSFGGLKYETAKVKDADNAQTNFNFNFAQQVNIGVSKNF
jgi:hypothetical protein